MEKINKAVELKLIDDAVNNILLQLANEKEEDVFLVDALKKLTLLRLDVEELCDQLNGMTE